MRISDWSSDVCSSDLPVRSPETDLDTEPEGCTFAARTQRFRRRLCVERLVELVVAAGAHAADGDGEDAVPTHLGDRVEDRVARTFGCLRWSGDESENCAEPDGYRPAKGPARLLRLDLEPGAAAPRCGSRAQVSASWHDFSVPPGRALKRLDEASALCMGDWPARSGDGPADMRVATRWERICRGWAIRCRYQRCGAGCRDAECGFVDKQSG